MLKKLYRRLTDDGVVVVTFDVDRSATQLNVVDVQVVVLRFEFLRATDVVAGALERRRLAVALRTRRALTRATGIWEGIF